MLWPVTSCAISDGDLGGLEQRVRTGLWRPDGRIGTICQRTVLSSPVPHSQDSALLISDVLQTEGLSRPSHEQPS